jgi:hypothetical protein
MPQAKWFPPMPLGRGSAVEGMTGIAAPLLAGFSLTLIGVIAQDPTHFRWPAEALVALVIAISLLIATVHFGFQARSYLYSAADMQDWRPDFFSSLEDLMAEDQRRDYLKWERWEKRAGWAYDLAVCLLAAGMALVVAPPAFESPGHPLVGSEASFRWAAFALGITAGAAQLGWVMATRLGHLRAPRSGSRPPAAELTGTATKVVGQQDPPTEGGTG